MPKEIGYDKRVKSLKKQIKELEMKKRRRDQEKRLKAKLRGLKYAPVIDPLVKVGKKAMTYADKYANAPKERRDVFGLSKNNLGLDKKKKRSLF